MASADRKEVAQYPYTNSMGEPVRRKIRFKPKGFSWECYTESGWQQGYGSDPPVLYRLPEVVAAVREGETVTVCEGEKDADNFRAAGAGTATTPPQNEPWPDGLAAPLAGADVQIIWDRDDDGARRARWAANALKAVGAAVTFWRPARGKD